MEAPDKIFVGIGKGENLEVACITKFKSCEIEYIRKDALLEWAKEDLDPMAYLQLIDKVKSL